MRVAFRVEVDAAGGGESLKRCRVLAAEFRRRGADVVFVVDAGRRPRTEGLDGIDLHELSELASNESADAEKTIGIVGIPDITIADHRALGESWEKALRQVSTRVVAIDTARRAHAIDVLIDPLNGPITGGDASGPRQMLTLGGPRFALIAQDDSPQGDRDVAGAPSQPGDVDGFGARRLVEVLWPT